MVRDHPGRLPRSCSLEIAAGGVGARTGAGSTPSMSMVGSPSTIHSASCQPAPPAAVMPKGMALVQPEIRGVPGAGPMIGLPSGV